MMEFFESIGTALNAGTLPFLIRSTLFYAIPLMIGALAGVFSERSGVINLALEGIMIFGAFVGVLFVRFVEGAGWFQAAYDAKDWVTMQGFALLAMAVTAIACVMFAMLLAFASIHLRADQTIAGTALNLLAPALVLFFVLMMTQQTTLQIKNPAANWFMLKESYFGFSVGRGANKTPPMGFLGQTFVNKMYPMVYLCILIFIVMSIWLYKTKTGLRLRACGENPQAADSLGINVFKMRYLGVGISGALAGIGGFMYVLLNVNCTADGSVAGFGFLALAVMIFGNWKPFNIAAAALFFGLLKCISASYTSLDINGDKVYWLKEIGVSAHVYRLLPYVITLLVLAFTSKRSRAPKAEGIPYDKSVR